MPVYNEGDISLQNRDRKHLTSEPVKVTELANELPTSAEDDISDLHSRIKKIYARVNMDVCFSLNYLCVWRSN